MVKTDIKVTCSGCGKEIKIHIGSIETMNARIQELEAENRRLSTTVGVLQQKLKESSSGLDAAKFESFFDALNGKKRR